MEKLLLRLAHQLDSVDEASLLDLWSKYATIASRFEPTKRWEEAVLVFSLIQAKHWKNQLFNYSLAQMSKPGRQGQENKEELSFGFSLEPPVEKSEKTPTKPCRVLSFRSLGAHKEQTEESSQETLPENDPPRK